MKNALSSKMTTLALVLAMLLNPLAGFAGQLLSQPVLQGESPSQSAANQQGAHEEHCHEHAPEPTNMDLAPASSSQQHQAPPQSSTMHIECCEDTCMCGQAGCQAPLAVLESSETPFSAVSTTFHSVLSRYISPTLSSLNPPPII